MNRAGIALAVLAWMGSGSAWAQPVPPPEPAAAEAAEPEDDDEPTVSVGSGRVKLGGLFQVWNLTTFAEEPQGGDANWTNTFRIRRAELKLEGVLVDDAIEMGIMVDPSKQVFGTTPSDARVVETDTDGDGVPDGTALVPRYRTNDTILQDLYLQFVSVPHLVLKVGQFKRPLGFEGPYSSAKLMFDERAQVSQALTGDNRDLGFMATLSLDPAKLTMDLGIFNGTPIVSGATRIASGVNEDDQNGWKDLILRIGAQPIKGLEIGVSGLYGVEGVLHPGDDPGSATDLRYGAWIRFSNDRIDLRAEGMAQAFNVEGAPIAHATGAYVLGEYRVIPKLGLGARFDVFDGTQNTDGDRSANYNVTGGVNYYLDDYHAKLQLAYTASIEGDLSDVDTDPNSGQTADDQVNLVAQVAF